VNWKIIYLEFFLFVWVFTKAFVIKYIPNLRSSQTHPTSHHIINQLKLPILIYSYFIQTEDERIPLMVLFIPFVTLRSTN
jgi:hypothetical protein